MTEVERLIAASPDRVWTLVSDLEQWDRMLPTMQQVRRLDGDGSPGAGARFEVRQPGLPKAVYEVTDWRPGAGFTWVSSSPGVRTTATHEIDSGHGRTRLRLGVEWSGPLAWLIRALVGAKARRMVEQEADTFARIAEDRDDADGRVA